MLFGEGEAAGCQPEKACEYSHSIKHTSTIYSRVWCAFHKVGLLFSLRVRSFLLFDGYEAEIHIEYLRLILSHFTYCSLTSDKTRIRFVRLLSGTCNTFALQTQRFHDDRKVV